MDPTFPRRAFIASLTLAPLAAADPWQQKSFTQWNEKEIQKILNDSPWAKSVAATLDSSAARPGGGAGGSRGGGRGGGGSRGGGGGGGGDMGGGGGGMEGGGDGGGSGGMQGGGPPTVNAVVRWVSALPVKQAIVTAQMGKEGAASEKAKALLEHEETGYTVGLLRLPGRYVRAAPEKLQAQLAGTTTVRRKGKEALKPEQVDVRRNGEFVSAYFQFSRKDPITLEQQEIEFVSIVGPLTFKKKFKLKDMVYNGKLAL